MATENQPLCLQPMTAADARFAEGRRAGLRDAAAHLADAAKELPAVGPVSRMLRLCYEAAADLVLARAGKS